MKNTHLSIIAQSLVLLGSISSIQSLQAQTVIINPSESWQYTDNVSRQNTDWSGPAFNDLLWSSPLAELRYADVPVTSEFQLTPNAITMVACIAPNVLLYGTRNKTSNSAEVYWTPVAGSLSYNVSYRIRNIAAAYSSPITTTTASLVLTNLLALTNYEFIVQSMCSGNILSPFTTSGFFTTLSAPVATCATPNINLFGTRNKTSNSAEVFWTPVTGTLSYNVEYRIRNIAAAYSTPINTLSASLVLTNLQSLTNYEFIVQSVCSGNQLTAFSPSGWFTTLIAPVGTCSVPDSNFISSRNITSNSAEVYWNAVAGVLSYNVEYRIQNSGAAYSAPFNSSSSSLVLINLLPSTNYEFIVQSLCSGNITSSFSSSRSFTTLPLPVGTCSIPDYLSFGARNQTSNSAEVYWNGVPGVLSYNVEYRIQNSGAAYSASFNSVSASLVLTNLLPLTIYEFIVQSFCPGNITSSFSLSAVFTTTAVQVGTCAIPNINLFGTRLRTSNSVQVFWTPVSGVTSYNVEYRIRNTPAAFSSPINTTVALLNLTLLQPLTNYEFIVQSVCTGNAPTAFSSSGWFSTLAGSVATTTLLRGPYMPVATSNSITIQWRTSIANSTEVKYDTVSTLLNNTVTNSSLSTEHSLTLTGLLPNTKYYYSIGPIGSVLQGDVSNYFYTAPVNGSTQSVKFWVTGDFGNGGAGQIAVRNSFTNYTSGQSINGWIWLGDNAYNNGTDLEYQTQVFNVYDKQFKSIPIFPAPGNHDYAQSGYQSVAALGVNFPYFNIFTLPSSAGTEKYYSTNYANIHFISLDSYGSYNNSTSAMYNWLSNDLANNTQQWTIVYFHHPPYSKGSHDSDTEIELINMRNNITPLLESYGVDLVLSGHSHNYERSYFIKNHTGLESTFNPLLYPAGNIVQAGGGPYTKSTRTGNGTVYVVCGISGQPGGTTTPGYPHNAMYNSSLIANGSLILEASGVNLNCKLLTISGTIDDEFTIQKPVPVPMVSARGSNPSDQLETMPFIYPNPSTGDINISINNTEEVQITVSISDLTGSVLFNRMYSKAKDTNLLIVKSESNLSAGIYIVNVSGVNINSSNKLVMY